MTQYEKYKTRYLQSKKQIKLQQFGGDEINEFIKSKLQENDTNILKFNEILTSCLATLNANSDYNKTHDVNVSQFLIDMAHFMDELKKKIDTLNIVEIIKENTKKLSTINNFFIGDNVNINEYAYNDNNGVIVKILGNYINFLLSIQDYIKITQIPGYVISQYIKNINDKEDPICMNTLSMAMTNITIVLKTLEDNVPNGPKIDFNYTYINKYIIKINAIQKEIDDYVSTMPKQSGINVNIPNLPEGRSQQYAIAQIQPVLPIMQQQINVSKQYATTQMQPVLPMMQQQIDVPKQQEQPYIRLKGKKPQPALPVSATSRPTPIVSTIPQSSVTEPYDEQIKEHQLKGKKLKEQHEKKLREHRAKKHTDLKKHQLEEQHIQEEYAHQQEGHIMEGKQLAELKEHHIKGKNLKGTALEKHKLEEQYIKKKHAHQQKVHKIKGDQLKSTHEHIMGPKHEATHTTNSIVLQGLQ